MEHKKYPDRLLRHTFAAPVIYLMIFPLLILDIFLEIYHQICFRLYKIPLVKRSNYVRIDRHKLKYLNIFDKFNCMYCGYASGLIHYAIVIAGKTEAYWCAIKHKKNKGFIEPVHHKNFLEYGDKKSFEEKYG